MNNKQNYCQANVTPICEICGGRGRIVAARYLHGYPNDRSLCYDCYQKHYANIGFTFAKNREHIPGQYEYLKAKYYGDPITEAQIKNDIPKEWQ